MSVIDLAGGVLNFVLGKRSFSLLTIPTGCRKYELELSCVLCRAYRGHWGADRGLCGIYGVCAEEPAGIDFEEEELRREGIMGVGSFERG